MMKQIIIYYHTIHVNSCHLVINRKHKVISLNLLRNVLPYATAYNYIHVTLKNGMKSNTTMSILNKSLMEPTSTC